MEWNFDAIQEIQELRGVPDAFFRQQLNDFRD